MKPRTLVKQLSTRLPFIHIFCLVFITSLDFAYLLYVTIFVCCPQNPLCRRMLGLNPRTVAYSSHFQLELPTIGYTIHPFHKPGYISFPLASSHPHQGTPHPRYRLHLIQDKLLLIHIRVNLVQFRLPAELGFFSSKLGFISSK